MTVDALEAHSPPGTPSTSRAAQESGWPLKLPIQMRWDGTACPQTLLHAEVTLEPRSDGLLLTARMPWRPTARIPEAPALQRVHNLWTYDVVECFLAGSEGYLEVELGAGGHFLVLSFTQPRVLACAYEALRPERSFQDGDPEHPWVSHLVIPWALLPVGLDRVNAYAIAEGEFLCFTPLPGEKPDYHQPARFQRFALLQTLPGPAAC